MTEEGHLQAFRELRTARARLRRQEDIRAYVELSFGMASHLLSAGAQRRHGLHREKHEGLGRWLREGGQADVAGRGAERESMRVGRWYGRQGNGDAATAIDRLLERLEAWAVAEAGR